MSAFHVVVRPERELAPSPALSPLYGLLDVVVDGVNITARIADGFAPSFLGDLTRAFAALSSGRSERTVIQLYAEHDVWELGLERDGDDVLITVFRSGPAPVVAVHERRVTLRALREGLAAALAEARSRSGGKDTPLASCRTTLETSWPPAAHPKVPRSPTTLTPAPRGSFAFNVSAPFRRAARPRPAVAHGTAVERADLHSLLVQGDFAVVARGRTATISGCFPFLVAERLIPLAEEALDAWQSGRAIFRRIQLGDSRIGVRRGPGDGPLDVSLSVGFGAADGKSVTFPAIDALDFAGAAVAIARRLVEAFTTNDPSHEKNLRLTCLASAVQALADRIEESAADDSVTNPEPETYRSFAPRAQSGAAKGPWAQGGKMRFSPSWVATVPNIDLKSTFLCGDRIVVGSAREIACLDRRTGSVVWRAPTARGGSIATPSGIARIEPVGKILLRDLTTGEIRFTARITPRAAGGATGAVVHAPGLPKLLVVSEGERSITALDLVTGDVRWRHTSRRAAAFRMRRAGKLLLVTGGDSALVAHDVSTGDIVWRVRDRLPFAHAMTIDHDSAFIVSGAPGGHWRLHHVDPWTGAVKYTAELSDAPLATQSPLVTGEVVAIATRDATGSGVRGFRRSDGAPLWEHGPGLLSPLATWLVVDDMLIANSSAGVLLCLDATTGKVRYNHVFSGSADCDQPRRLEPVLRGGALFVPQHQVVVVRPRDGEVIGTVPSDLIPDLLRVDERCDVYIGEESGHLAAFTTAARLALVR